VLTLFFNILMGIPSLLIKPEKEITRISLNNFPHSKVVQYYLLPVLILHILISLTDMLLAGYSPLSYSIHSIELLFYLLVQPLSVVYAASVLIRSLSRMFEGSAEYGKTVTIVTLGIIPFLLGRTFTIIDPRYYYVELAGIYGMIIIWKAARILLQIKESKKVAFILLSAIIITGLDYIFSKLMELIVFMMNLIISYYN